MSENVKLNLLGNKANITLFEFTDEMSPYVSGFSVNAKY